MKTKLIGMSFLLGQSSLDSALNQSGVILFKMAFLVGVVCIMSGGWSIRKGEAELAKMSIIGGAIIALAGRIMEALFAASGMQESVIHFN